MNQAFIRSIIVAVFMAMAGLLTGCGGSDNNTANPPPAPVPATTVIHYAVLAGAQENPPALTAAAGTAVFSVTTGSGQIVGTVSTSGLVGNAAHIHIAEPGINGPIIIPLTQSTATSGVWIVPPNIILTGEQMAALNAGSLYANVHSDLLPGGQIRGQIGRTVLTAKLAGSQENPPTPSAAAGTGVFSVDPVTRALSARVVTSGITATAAHIHSGPIGVNAPVAIGFAQTAPGSGIWVPPANTVLTPEQFQSFSTGGTYFNVHSAAFPGGEIRGQIGRDVIDVVLAGAQEVPPVVGGGSATSRIIVNPITRDLTGFITNNGVTATAGHIHNGLFGVNAPVLIPTTQSAAGSPVWNFAPTALSEAQYRSLLFGNMYVNTHSAAFPGGEARAQAGNIVRTGLLAGANEVPPTSSTATGRGRADLNPGTLGISITVTTTGIAGAAAHLHIGAAGVNGPVIVPLTEGPVGTWTSATGATLTQAQAVAFAAGGTYFNVHSAALPGGEIRAQAAGFD